MTLLFALACTGSSASTETAGSPTDTTSDTAAATPPVPLIEHGQVSCSDPDARDAEGPYVRTELGSTWQDQLPEGWEGDFDYGNGLVVVDFDGDGLLDLLAADEQRPQLFLGRDDGRLTDGPPLPTLEDLDDDESWRVSMASAADIDGDGDLDVLLGLRGHRDRLWLNVGEATFADVTATSGLPAVEHNLRTAPWGDIDGDGDLDLFLGYERDGNEPPDPGQDNALLLNVGDGVFEDVSDRLQPEDRDGYTMGGAFVDVDDDGDQDLYIVNHRPTWRGNRLLLNAGDGTFEAAGEDAGLDVVTEGMGLGIGDLNGDGWPDMLVSGWGETPLMESAGDGTWYRTEAVRGLVPDATIDQVVGWGSELADLDNDGDLDAMTMFGPGGGSDELEDPDDQPDGTWLQGDDGVFESVGEAWGLDQTRSHRSVALVDFDRDGWLDVFKGATAGKARYYAARCGEASWLGVRLQGEAPNTGASGARVEVTVGETVHTRWVVGSGSGYQVTLPPEAHFGLGEAATVDQLVVHWPAGQTSTWTDVDARQWVTAIEPGAE